MFRQPESCDVTFTVSPVVREEGEERIRHTKSCENDVEAKADRHLITRGIEIRVCNAKQRFEHGASVLISGFVGVRTRGARV